MASSGNPNITAYSIMANFEEVEMIYYDTDMKTLEPRHDWVRQFSVDHPQYSETLSEHGVHYEQAFEADTECFKQHSNETEGMFMTKCYL